MTVTLTASVTPANSAAVKLTLGSRCRAAMSLLLAHVGLILPDCRLLGPVLLRHTAITEALTFRLLGMVSAATTRRQMSCRLLVPVPSSTMG